MIIPFYEHHVNPLQGGCSNTLNFPLHLHNTPEIVRVRAGMLKIQLHTEEYYMKAGDFALILPNVIHSYTTLSDPQDTIIDLLIFGQDSLSMFPKKYIGARIPAPIKPISLYHADVDYVLTALLNELGSIPDKHIISAYMQILWHRILPQLTITDTLQPAASDMATTLITYITEHFCEPLSLDTLSKEMGVCRFYLSRIFTQILHVGFYEYINALRINYAKDLLRNRKDSILDISMQCGFQSQQTFNRVFKEICGMTPTAYRRIQ